MNAVAFLSYCPYIIMAFCSGRIARRARTPGEACRTTISPDCADPLVQGAVGGGLKQGATTLFALDAALSPQLGQCSRSACSHEVRSHAAVLQCVTHIYIYILYKCSLQALVLRRRLNKRGHLHDAILNTHHKLLKVRLKLK